MPSFSPLLLDVSDPSATTELLRSVGFLFPGESISRLSVAGPGNMNVVLRVETNQRSFVAKQSRPWVSKFPQIQAPEDRIEAEIQFYRMAGGIKSVSDRMPTLLHADPENRLLILEDLGAAADYGHVYASQSATDLPIGPAAEWLAELHHHARPLAGIGGAEIGSFELLKLNRDHIFVIPFATPAMVDLDDVTDGLQKVASELNRGDALIERIKSLSRLYLGDSEFAINSETPSTNRTLLHGDFYPGSWLHTHNGLRVIDAEFCFIGPVEFDVSTLVAHIWMSSGDQALVQQAIDHYVRHGQELGTDVAFDEPLARDFAAVEVLRRVLGVAQLPLPKDLRLKRQLVDQARRQLERNR